MKNWRTTLAGIVTAGFGFVLFSPDLFSHWPWLVAVAKYSTVGGLAAMGFAGKDCTTHSTVAQVERATDEK
jgi:hypothetical protein